jgi:hypothetical protein
MAANDQIISGRKEMSILQINFKLNVAPAEYRKICSSVAQPIADVPGLMWKVWILNEQDGEAGGIYLFQDKQEISAKWFEAIPELTVVTRGPIPAPATT